MQHIEKYTFLCVGKSNQGKDVWIHSKSNASQLMIRIYQPEGWNLRHHIAELQTRRIAI
jgi:hypothetical protein